MNECELSSETGILSGNRRSRIVLRLLCFAVPALAMILIYCFLGVFPVGKRSVLVLDLNAQYVYFLEGFRDIITSGESILYSFRRALGGEFMGMFAYYLSSPFSLIVALFPKKLMTEAVYTILVLKCGCCGLSFGYLLEKRRPLRAPFILMLSTAYALSSYAVVMQHNLMWTDNLIAFPLVLLATDELIMHGRYKLFVVSIAYSLLSNFYIGYMTCLFVLIWFFIRYFMLGREERNPAGEKAHFIRTFLRACLCAVIAVAISAVIILPAYYSLTLGKFEFSKPDYSPRQLFEFADILTKAFFGSYDTVRSTGMPFIYCGTVSLILVPLYFCVKSVPVRRKIGFSVILAILAVSFNLSTLDLIWHGFQRPNWLNARFAFMFTALILLMTAEVLAHLDEIGMKAVICSAAIWAAILIVLSKIGYDNLPVFLAVWSGLLCIALAAGFTAHTVRVSGDAIRLRRMSAALCCLMIAEAVANGTVMLYALDDDVTYGKRDAYRQLIDEYSEAAEAFRDDTSFYRADKLAHPKKNDNFATGLRGLSNSTSTLNARTVALLQQFGFASQSHWSLYSGSTMVTDAIFGVKYVMADETDEKPAMRFITDLYDRIAETDEQISVFRNPYSLSLAFAVNEEVLGYDEPSEEEKPYTDPFTYMNGLLSAMTGEEVTVWRPVETELTEESGVDYLSTSGHRGYKIKDGSVTPYVTFPLDIDSTDDVYVYFPSKYPKKATLKLNGNKLGTYFDGDSFAIRELGSFEPGQTVRVALSPETEKLYFRSGVDYFWYFDEEACVSVLEKLRDGALDGQIEKDDRVDGVLTVPEDCSVVFTSIPYDKYWQVMLDGEEVEKISVLNDSLIAFRAEPGEHSVSFRYRPLCVYRGAMISVAGLVLLAAVWTAESLIRKKKKKKVEAVPPAVEPEEEAPAAETVADNTTTVGEETDHD